MKTAAAVTAASLTQSWPVFAAEPAPGAKPNILLVICDQMVLDAIGAYQKYLADQPWLCHWVDTPHLDDLVRSGVSFTQAHSPNPVCCPARSCIFTGRYALETGVIFNNIGIDRSVPNMGQWFEQHSNYQRVYCGKWHAGGPWNNPHVAGPRKIPSFETLPNGPDNWGRHMDYGVSGSVEAYLRNYRDARPFLAVAGFMDPHDICFWTPKLNNGRTRSSDFFSLAGTFPQLPPNLHYDFKEIWHDPISFSAMQWHNYIYDYCRMVERLDRNVGRLLRAVRDRGDDTILIFMSDHGDGVGRHSRVQKWHPYDESVKVPLIVYGPKFGIRRGVVDTTSLVGLIDIMATVCDYAGLPCPPHCRGMSLRPLLEGRPTPWRENLFIELREVGRVIRSRQYKYVMSYQPAPRSARAQANECFLTQDGQPSLFITGEGNRFRRVPTVMLFDMQNDPWETRNLAEDPKFAQVIAEHETLNRQYEAQLIPGREFTRA